MNRYNRYRCEWRVNILAETPKEAAQKAEELMRSLPSSFWRVIDEHGNEQTFEVPPLGRLPAQPAPVRREMAQRSKDDD